jgi:hypothetical protein
MLAFLSEDHFELAQTPSDGNGTVVCVAAAVVTRTANAAWLDHTIGQRASRRPGCASPELCSFRRTAQDPVVNHSAVCPIAKAIGMRGPR